jgi:hypothetical protein
MLLDERDIGNFLLHAFSRHRQHTELLVNALNAFQPKNWIGIAGAIRALIWLGLREYADDNAELIKDAQRDAGPGWSVVLDTDIADIMPHGSDSFLDTLSSFAKVDRIRQIEAFRDRQTPKASAFARANAWLLARTDAPELPADTEEWLAAAQAGFWIGRLDAGWPLLNWLPVEETLLARESLPLEAAADLAAGLAEGYGAHSSRWLETFRRSLRERFQAELLSPILEDDGSRVTAHFIVTPDVSSEGLKSNGLSILDSDNPLHNEALVRVNLLRRLCPDRESYGCQGYGHGSSVLQLKIDDTHKAGIPRNRLPLRWQTFVNATFNGIVAFDSRPSDWADYADEVLELREAVVHSLASLVTALPPYLRSFRPKAVSVPGDTWYNAWILLRDPPRLPQTAVDEWGFVYESLTESAIESGHVNLRQIPSVRKYRPIVEAVRSYARSLSNFHQEAASVVAANQRLQKESSRGKRKNKSHSNQRHWANASERRNTTQNLADAWMLLSQLQKEYRHYFTNIADRQRIDILDRKENDLFAEAWPLWFSFALHPEKVLDYPNQYARELIQRNLQRLHRSVRKELNRLSTSGVTITLRTSSVPWESEPVMWLMIDGEDGVDVYGAAVPALEAVRRAISHTAHRELRQYLLQFHLQSVAVVPLIRGKSLNGTAWRLNTSMLTRTESTENLSWLQLLMQHMPPRALELLGIEIWNDERLVLGNRLIETSAKLWPLIVHVAELAEIPEVEGVGEEIALRHINEMMTEVNDSAQPVIDAATALLDSIINALEDRPSQVDRSYITATEALRSFLPAVLPTQDFQGNATLEVRQFRQWAERLSEGMQYALVAQLSWTSATLRASNQSD